jgi:CRISPR/Cas system-associated protein Cas7 (RAMP superfamily)
LYVEKAHGYAKRNKRKSMEKINKCPNEKKRKRGKIYNKIVHVSLQLFLSLKERNIYIEQSRIRLSHYISPIHLISYTCTS